MTDEYTPTTEEVRLDYVVAYTNAESSQILAGLAFDRWRAAHEAAYEEEVRNQIVRELVAEEAKIRGYVDFDRHRDSLVGEINGLRRAAHIVKGKIT